MSTLVTKRGPAKPSQSMAIREELIIKVQEALRKRFEGKTLRFMAKELGSNAKMIENLLNGHTDRVSLQAMLEFAHMLGLKLHFTISES